MRWGRVGAVLLLGWVATAAQSLDAQRGSRTTPDVERTVYDMRKLGTASSLSDTELTGRRLFVQRCAICHDPVGQPLNRTPGPWLDQRTFASGSEPAARELIESGSDRMPGFRHALRSTQIDHIVAYLKTVTPDARPD